MPPPATPDLPQVILATLVILGIFACIAVWGMIAVRWHQGLPVLPYQPRRRVPWRAVDTGVLVLIYICAPQFVMQASKTWLGTPIIANAQAAKAAPDDSHILSRILSESHSPWAILLCVVSAVIIAPLGEELVFRLVLQGWLESLERRMRRRVPLLRRIVAGLFPVALVATLFAAMHFRTAGPRLELSVVISMLEAFVAAGVLTIVTLVCWLKFAAGATLVDFGIVPGQLMGDVRLGLLGFLAVMPPVYAVMIAMKLWLPEISVPDPVPILLLGLAFGGLYYRTHRIVPSIVMHSAFNAVGVFVAIAGSP